MKIEEIKSMPKPTQVEIRVSPYGEAEVEMYAYVDGEPLLENELHLGHVGTLDNYALEMYALAGKYYTQLFPYGWDLIFDEEALQPQVTVADLPELPTLGALVKGVKGDVPMTSVLDGYTQSSDQIVGVPYTATQLEKIRAYIQELTAAYGPVIVTYNSPGPVDASPDGAPMKAMYEYISAAKRLADLVNPFSDEDGFPNE